MLIVAHGVDIVKVERVAHSIEEYGERYLTRVFTKEEREYCEGRAKRRSEHYAGRFAAKEAALKCLGTGWSKGIAWTDVSIRNDTFGVPHLVVAGKAQEYAMDLGIRRWLVSVSHTSENAMASVIATK